MNDNNDKNEASNRVTASAPAALDNLNVGRRGVLRSGMGVTAFSLLGAGTALLSACGGGGGGGDGVATAPPAPSPAPPVAAPPPAAPAPAPDAPPAEAPVSAPTLTGRAVLPADSFVAGPTSGQYVSGGDYERATKTYGYTFPFVDKQPMQGFSALVPGPFPGMFYAMQDNGFGGRAASPDALLHIYAVRFDFDKGTVVPAHFQTGAVLASFTPDSYVLLSDPNRKLGYATVADMSTYPGA